MAKRSARRRDRRPRVFSIVEPAFKVEPLFVVGCSFSDFARLLKRRYGVTADDVEERGTYLLGSMLSFDCAPWRVIWIKRNDLGAATHEIMHLVIRICQDKGIPIVAHHPNGDHGDETAAYLIEFFVNEYRRHMATRGRRPR